MKGPIPLRWLSVAAKKPGKAFNLAIAIWFIAGLKNSSVVRLSTETLQEFGISRHASYDALKGLEKAGLIHANRKRGRLPIITIKDC